ncbi:cystic fibrosis transmembrane conductance regulator-like protein [Corchorus olitorius]|uniref:Cystic fibrosis transmembrane conductance regulator-like protein n=1 Tax=Corchorus olitorius TaxID=93759 RepID=A0A1R3GHS3_9ROSI|nr:cystic fibrosis transmembrane conductance regulator-like protein [Corchorus olitorius]
MSRINLRGEGVRTHQETHYSNAGSMGKPRFNQFHCPNRMFYLTQISFRNGGMAYKRGFPVPELKL